MPAVAAGEVEELEEVQVLDQAPDWAPANKPEAQRIINVATARVTRRLALQFSVDHRAFQPVRQDPFRDLLGLDGGGLKVGLGLRFGVWDDLDLGIARLSRGTEAFTVYEFDAAWRFVRQQRLGLDASLRGGLTVFQQVPLADSATGGYGQLALTRGFFGERVILSTGVLFHSKSTSDSKSDADTAWSLAVPGGLEGRLLPWLALDLEVVGTVAGYRARYPAISGAVRILTQGHAFTLLVSNTQYLSADGIVPGSRRGLGEVIFGFTITREFQG